MRPTCGSTHEAERERLIAVGGSGANYTGGLTTCIGDPLQCNVRVAVMCMHIVFIAFGTRGDVQPIACLAEHIRRCHPLQGVRATLITHAAHHSWLAAQPYTLLPTSYINSSPYGPEASTEADDDGLSEEWGQASECWEVLQSMEPRASLIVFNLFALEVGLAT